MWDSKRFRLIHFLYGVRLVQVQVMCIDSRRDSRGTQIFFGYSPSKSSDITERRSSFCTACVRVHSQRNHGKKKKLVCKFMSKISDWQKYPADYRRNRNPSTERVWSLRELVESGEAMGRRIPCLFLPKNVRLLFYMIIAIITRLSLLVAP